ncbi:uncharacterized protein LOC144907329 isoform X1 [Branchiostoma floridae x Branchiostoma belcheri]
MTLSKVAMLLLVLHCITGRGFRAANGEEGSTYKTDDIEISQISKEDQESDNIHDVLRQMGIYIDDDTNQKHLDDKKDQAANSEEESSYTTDDIENPREDQESDNIHDVLRQMGIYIDDDTNQKHLRDQKDQVKTKEAASQVTTSGADDIYDILRARGLNIVDDDTHADKSTRKQEERGVLITGQKDDSADKPINVINNEIYIPRRLWDKYVREGKIRIINNMINVYLPQPIDLPGGKDEYHANLPSGPITIQVGAEPDTLGDTKLEKGKAVLPSVVLGRIAKRDTTSTSDEDIGTVERNKRSEKADTSERKKEEEDVGLKEQHYD